MKNRIFLILIIFISVGSISIKGNAQNPIDFEQYINKPVILTLEDNAVIRCQIKSIRGEVILISTSNNRMILKKTAIINIDGDKKVQAKQLGTQVTTVIYGIGLLVAYIYLQTL